MRVRSGLVGAAIILVVACAGGRATGMPAGEHVHSFAVTADGDLLLGLHGGLYRSATGAEWDLAGLSGEDAMVIAAAAGEPVFVAGHEVLYRSDDGGDTFSPLSPPDLPGVDIHGFAQAPADGSVVYAYVVGHGLFASIDAGETWEPRASIESLAPNVFGIAVVGSSTDTLVMVGPESGVLRSKDGGRTFSSAFDVPAVAVAVEPDDPNVVWALTAAGPARSVDAGGTWDVVGALDGVEGQPVTLAVEESVLWVVTEQPRALYRSDDTGVNWERLAGP